MSEFAFPLTKALDAALVEVTGAEPTEAEPVVVLAAYIDALAKEFGLSESLNLDLDPIERTQQVGPVMKIVRHYFGATKRELTPDLVRSRLYDTVVVLAADPQVRKILNQSRPLTENRVLALAQIYWNLEGTSERAQLPLRPAKGMDIPVPGIAADFATMTWTERVNQKANCKSSGQGFRTQGARLAVLVAKHLSTHIAPAPGAPARELELRPTRDAEEPVEITLKGLAERAWAQGDYDDATDLSRGYFQIIKRRADANPFDMESALAGAYLLKGTASLRPNRDTGRFNVGDDTTADLERAVASYTTLSELDPHDDTNMTELMNAQLLLCVAYSESGRIDDSIRAGHKAVSIAERRAASQPDDAERQRTWRDTLMALSWPLHTAGRFEEAGATMTRAVAIVEQLVATEPSEPAHEAMLVALLWGLSQNLGAVGRFEDAVHVARRAVAICETSSTPHTDNQKRLASSLVGLGNALRDAGRFDEAIAAAERSVTVREYLVAAEPASDEHRENLATTLLLLGSLLREAHRAEAVPATLSRAVEIFMDLAAKESEPGKHHILLLASLDDLSRALRDLGRFDEAQVVDEVRRSVDGE